jgi:GINS complex subunit 3
LRRFYFISFSLLHHRITIPEIYQSAYTEICKADPNAVELGRLNKYFYEFGRYIVRFDRHNTVGKMLYETCRERAVYLKDLCNNINNESRQDSKLENLENLLFEEGCKTNREVKRTAQIIFFSILFTRIFSSPVGC